MVESGTRRRVRHRLGGPNRFLFLGPSVLVLLVWMVVPLVYSLYFSFRRYNLVIPTLHGYVGFQNYVFLLTDPNFWSAVWNTLVLVLAVLVLTTLFGLLFAILFNRNFLGKNVVRTLAISPFFVMPIVTALMWKDMILNPVFGLLSWITTLFHGHPVAWLTHYPMASVVTIISWEWVPFAMLILLTALQSLPNEQLEAARLDGADSWNEFRYIVLPHLTRPISALLMLETIFFLSIFAQIYGTTSGGPGLATTNLPYYIFLKAMFQFNIGGASAAGILAVILANVVAVFLLRLISRNLFDEEVI